MFFQTPSIETGSGSSSFSVAAFTLEVAADVAALSTDVDFDPDFFLVLVESSEAMLQ